MAVTSSFDHSEPVGQDAHGLLADASNQPTSLIPEGRREGSRRSTALSQPPPLGSAVKRAISALLSLRNHFQEHRIHAALQKQSSTFSACTTIPSDHVPASLTSTYHKNRNLVCARRPTTTLSRTRRRDSQKKSDFRVRHRKTFKLLNSKGVNLYRRNRHNQHFPNVLRQIMVTENSVFRLRFNMKKQSLPSFVAISLIRP